MSTEVDREVRTRTKVMMKIRTNFWDVETNAPGKVFDSKEALDAYCFEQTMIPSKIEYFSDHTVGHGKFTGEKVAGMTREELVQVVEDLDAVCAELLEHALK